MSIKALNWAIHEADVTNPLQKWMLVCLADFHNQETGQCNPSVATLLKMSGMKRSTVYQYLKELEAEGIITKDTSYRENGSQTTNYYYLNMDGVHELDGGVHEPDPLNQYTNINIENKENIVNNVDVVNNVVDNVVNNVVPIDTNDDLETMEIWEETLSKDWRWKPFTSERSRRDWIERKKSLAEKYGIHLNDLAEAVVEYLARPEYQDPKKMVRSTFNNWVDRRIKDIKDQNPTTGNASHSNQDKYTQAKSELGR